MQIVVGAVRKNIGCAKHGLGQSLIFTSRLIQSDEAPITVLLVVLPHPKYVMYIKSVCQD